MSFVDAPPGYGTRTVIDNAFRAAGVERTVTLEVADLGTAATYIRNGLGIGFLSWSILDDIDDSGSGDGPRRRLRPAMAVVRRDICDPPAQRRDPRVAVAD